MNIANKVKAVTEPSPSFDLFRLTKARSAVDLAPNTLRAYARQGLNLYHVGRAVFVSRAELAEFIKRGPCDNHESN